MKYQFYILNQYYIFLIIMIYYFKIISVFLLLKKMNTHETYEI